MRSPVAAQQLWWPRLLAVLLLAMVRVLVRRNGTQDPAFALRIDTVGDAATAKQAFVDEAAGLLRVERTVPYEKVGIFLPGGPRLACEGAQRAEPERGGRLACEGAARQGA